MSSGAVGALAQVQAVSNQSLWLDVAPEATFFQQEYARYSPFAIVESDICPQSGVRFGGCLQYEIPRAGDLLGAVFHKLKVRGLRFAAGALNSIGGVLVPADAILQWVNCLGHAVHREVQLDIGQIRVDTFTGVFMEILEQHRSPVGNEQGESIGCFDNGGDLRDWSFNNQTLHVALHFFFFEHPEVYLPIIALSAHPVRIKCFLREKVDLINASDDLAGNVCLDAISILDATFNGALDDAALVVRMVFLDQFERNLVSAEVHEIVMLEHQEDCSEVILAGTTTKSVTLSFNNAIIAMFAWYRMDKDTARTINAAQNCNKEHFGFCIPRPQDEIPPHIAATTPLQVTPFATWQIKFNGADRVAVREAEYFTQVTAFLHAVKKQKSRCVLFYPFHLATLSDYHVPAGHAMFSRIHEVKSCVTFRLNAAGASALTVLDTSTSNTIEETVGDGEWNHGVLSYNVLRISMGQAIKKFA